MAISDQGTGGWTRALEAALVLTLLVLLSPLLILLLGIKIVRKAADWRKPRPDGARRDTTWGLFVST